MAETSDWKTYWRDTSRAPIERLVQWWKEKYGYRRFANFVPRGPVLEVGSGRGIVSAELIRKGLRVVTSDIDPSLGCDHTFDARKIPFADNSFEVVMSTGVMEHFNNKELESGLDEQLRVAPTVIMNVPMRSIFWHILWTIRRLLGARLDLHFNLMSEREISWFLIKRKIRCRIHVVRFGLLFPYMVVICRRPYIL